MPDRVTEHCANPRRCVDWTREMLAHAGVYRRLPRHWKAQTGREKSLSRCAGYGIVGADPMSEFKFACPVCGQHITVPSSSSGKTMNCPTCFRPIVIPQAPAGNDSKLLLSAAEPAQPRPTSAVPDLGPLRHSRSRGSIVAVIISIVLIGAAATAVYSFRMTILRALGAGGQGSLVQTTQSTNQPTPLSPNWTLEPAKVVIPEGAASGRLHGSNFVCEKALFAGGTLSLRKGAGWPPDLGLDILLSAQKAEQLSGKSIVIAPGARSVVSKIVLRWKDDQNRGQKQEFTSGYALTLLFGQAAGQRLPGRLHVSLPDADKSFAAGTFEAEVVQLRTAGK